ncbi:MAG: NAD(P)H-hydrate dehydratase [Betaproteobacteria bacterium]
MAQDSVLRVGEVRLLERGAAGLPLMERAGLAAAEIARERIAARSASVQVLAGPGNNGGDALVVARLLKSWYFDVEVAFASDAERFAGDAAAAWRAWNACGGITRTQWSNADEPGLIVDGLFGIGLARDIGAPHAQWIARANHGAAPVLALDIPSGLNADTGCAGEHTMRADATATFIALKPGLLTADGPDHCGTISVHTLGLDIAGAEPTRGRRLRWQALRESLPETLWRRRHNVHKGTFGTLSILGGSDGMVGAPFLAGRAALRLGAGKVRLGLAGGVPLAVDWQMPELMIEAAQRVLAASCDALVVGPGLGDDASARAALAQALAAPTPLVIDAGALNLIAADASLGSMLATRAAATAITPHPAEAARLLQCDTDSIQSDRVDAALRLAARFNAATVLKGAGSVLAFTDGTWAINASGSAALASAGTGDVLAGMIGAFLAQGIAVDEALALAVSLHGAAADSLVEGGRGPLGLVASELAPEASRLINAATRNGRATGQRVPPYDPRT